MLSFKDSRILYSADAQLSQSVINVQSGVYETYG